MSSKLLCTDILAIRCIRDYVLVGVGYMLYIYNSATYKLIGKLSCLCPNNIHGIVNDVNNKLAIYGSRSLCICDINFGLATFKEKKVTQRFDDWIIAVKWLSHRSKTELAILFADNRLCVYNVNTQEKQYFFCEEKCILYPYILILSKVHLKAHDPYFTYRYGGSIAGETIEDCVIFSGTVFQEIIIWKPICNSSSTKHIPVLHRLLGHCGVIFSVIYDPAANVICSTSDDRTVRLWTITNKNTDPTKGIDWTNVDVALSKTMFGHSARIWRVIVRNKTLVSIGEDSLVCIWSLTGQLIKKINVHHGATIWSVDISQDNGTIFTGGADGAVSALPFTCISDPNVISLTKPIDNNCPKHICYLKSGTVLIFNEGGTVLCYNKNDHIVRESLYLEKYSTYCIIGRSPSRSYVCFGSRDGYITIYKEKGNATEKLSLVLEDRAMDSQIFSLQWLEDDKILVCGSQGLLKLIKINIDRMTMQTKSEFVLPASRERWVTAAIIYNNFLICGDRTGSVHVFDPYQSAKNIKFGEPIQSLTKVHGRIGVQSYTILENKLITMGRDGTLRYYEFYKNDKRPYLHNLHSTKMPMNWICDTRQVYNDMLVLGFQETEFVIFSMWHKKVLTKIPCGGGHRSWDCIILDKLIHFAYIRNKQAYKLNYPLHTQLSSPRLQNGFHTKEIYSMQPLLTSSDYSILLSGSEDCTLRVNYISRIENDNYNIRTLSTLDGHLSCVKCTAIVNLRDTPSIVEHLIFSGGGRAQLKVWKIKILHDEDNVSNESVSCADLKSHMLHDLEQRRNKPWEETNYYLIGVDTRYMSINAIYSPLRNSNKALIFIGCADGNVRVFSYDIVNNSINLQGFAACSSRCILMTHVIQNNDRTVLLTMATDGFVRFFDFTDKLFNIADTLNNESTNLTVACFEALRLHQSGINSYDYKVLNYDTHALVTGGDDNLISFVVFKVFRSKNGVIPSVSIVSKWSSSSIHAAQIPGVKFCGNDKVISVGLDQQVTMYTYNFVNNVLSVKTTGKFFTCVTDVQGMLLYPSTRKAEITVCVYGKGFEILCLSNDFS